MHNFGALNENDWLQIEQAASGCISGTSDDWPALRQAIALITGKPFTYRKSASWLQGFCEGILIQSSRVKEWNCCGTTYVGAIDYLNHRRICHENSTVNTATVTIRNLGVGS